jgi:hypothetical protein
VDGRQGIVEEDSKGSRGSQRAVELMIMIDHVRFIILPSQFDVYQTFSISCCKICIKSRKFYGSNQETKQRNIASEIKFLDLKIKRFSALCAMLVRIAILGVICFLGKMFPGLKLIGQFHGHYDLRIPHR